MLLAVGAAIVSYCSGRTSTAEFVLLALILCYIAFRKELLWRIRNRLLITSFLFAVVPIFLIGLALILTTELLLGQFATQRVHQDLEARIENVRGIRAGDELYRKIHSEGMLFAVFGKLSESGMLWLERRLVGWTDTVPA